MKRIQVSFNWVRLQNKAIFSALNTHISGLQLIYDTYFWIFNVFGWNLTKIVKKQSLKTCCAVWKIQISHQDSNPRLIWHEILSLPLCQLSYRAWWDLWSKIEQVIIRKILPKHQMSCLSVLVDQCEGIFIYGSFEPLRYEY